MENLKFLKEINDYNEEDSLLEYELMLKHKVSLNKKGNSRILKPLNNNISSQLNTISNYKNDKISNKDYSNNLNNGNNSFKNTNLNEKQIDLLFEKSINVLKEYDHHFYLTENKENENFINEIEKLMNKEDNDNDDDHIERKKANIMSSELTLDLQRIIQKSEQKFQGVINEFKKYIVKDNKNNSNNNNKKEENNYFNYNLTNKINNESNSDSEQDSDSDIENEYRSRLNMSDNHIFDKIVGIKDKLIDWMNIEKNEDEISILHDKNIQNINKSNKSIENDGDKTKNKIIMQTQSIKENNNSLTTSNNNISSLSITSKKTSSNVNKSKIVIGKLKENSKYENDKYSNMNILTTKTFSLSNKYLNKQNDKNESKENKDLKTLSKISEIKENIQKSESTKINEKKIALSNKNKFELFNYTDDKFSIVKLQHKRNDRKSLMKNKIIEKVKADKLFKHDFKMKNIDDINLFVNK